MTSTKKVFPRLFEPISIGAMCLKNRIAMAPMVSKSADEKGFVTLMTKDYYCARARGGAGLIIVEATYVDHPRGRGYRNQLSIADDKHIPELKALAKDIQGNGAKVAIQIQHSGPATKMSLTGSQPVAPSAIPVQGWDVPRELTTSEVEDIVREFGDGALRACKAGFDGVEIHAAHYYLLARFLSPACNKRVDKYGGSTENRSRVLVEIINTMKHAAGKDYPVWIRFNGEEYGADGALNHEEAKQIAVIAEKAGADAIHVSCWDLGANSFSTMGKQIKPIDTPYGFMINLAEGIKKVVNIPVIAVGRITPEIGEEALEEGKADIVAIGRGLIADPELPNKAAQGKVNDINICIACGDCNTMNMVCSQLSV
ncbi:NADH:flavin oxidoreductase [Chloroflexota bacterium]